MNLNTWEKKIGQPSSSQCLHEYLKITKPTGSGWKRVRAPHILDIIPFKSEDIRRGNNSWQGKKKSPLWEKTKILNFSFQQVRIAHNSHFIPSRLEAGFRKWEWNSSILLDQMFEAEDLVFFEQLQHKYNKYDRPPHYFSALEKGKKWDKLHAVPLKYEAICYH